MEDVYKGLEGISRGTGNLLRLRDALLKQKGTILLRPPAQEQSIGEYRIGTLWNRHAPAYTFPLNFGLKENEWTQHLAIYGRSGGGKSNTLKIILLSFAEHNNPFMILDWKREYRHLLGEKNFEDLLIFTVGNQRVSPFRFNFLLPPRGVSPETYLGQLSEVIAFSFFLGDGAINVMRNAIEFVYANFGVFENLIEKEPRWVDVRNFLQNEIAKIKPFSREYGWYESCLRSVEEICRRGFGQDMNPEESLPLESLLEKKVVIELDNLPSKQSKVFFTQSLVMWIHLYRLSNPNKGKFHSMIIEEAQNCLDKDGQQRLGETIIEKSLREMRSLGESLILVTQHPSRLPIQAGGNVYTTISLNLKHYDDVKAAAKSMLLGYNEENYLGMLPVGFAIVKLQDRCTLPFQIKLPLYTEKEKVSDMDVINRMRAITPHTLSLKVPKPKEELIPLGNSQHIEEREFDLLKSTIQEPFLLLKERFDSLTYSVKVGEILKQNLKEKGLIKEKIFQTSKFGVGMLVYPSESGELALKALGFKTKTKASEGDLIHRFFCFKVAEKFRRDGHEVFPEKNNVDVIAIKDKKIHIEIETGSSDFIHNVKKSLNSDCDEILMLATDKKAYAIIKKKLIEFGLLEHPKVKLDLVQNILG